MEVFLDDHVIEGTEKKHVSYIIKCKLNGKEFTAKRRYNDFFNLFTALSTKYKITAKLPPKMVFGNMNVTNINKRRIGLHEFLIQLIRDDKMGDNSDVLEFLNIKENSKETKVTIAPSKSSEDKDVYISLYDYKKQDDTELDLKKGDHIKVIEKDETSGWWYGYNIDSPKVYGFFPNNYLIQVDPSSKTYIVDFDFIGESPSELTIKIGEELELIEIKNGWCHVINSQKKKGWVPQDYIKLKGK